MRVGVTGATGFVGKSVVAALTQAGYQAVPLIRKARGGVDDVIIPDIADPTACLPDELALDVVIHLVALTHVVNDNGVEHLQQYRAINVGGTQNALELARINGARRFIYLSSIKVNGESTPVGKPFTEQSPQSLETSYGISKFEAEQLVTEQATALGMEAIIIRPPLVYGFGARGNFPKLISLATMGLPLPFGLIRNARSMIFVENLANAIVMCVGHPSAAGQTYLISDGEDLSTSRLTKLIASAAGKKARMLSVPPSLLLAVARLFGQAANFGRLCGSLQIDSSKIRRDLGWSPPVSLEDGIALSVAGRTLR